MSFRRVGAHPSGPNNTPQHDTKDRVQSLEDCLDDKKRYKALYEETHQQLMELYDENDQLRDELLGYLDKVNGLYDKNELLHEKLTELYNENQKQQETISNLKKECESYHRYIDETNKESR